MTGDKMKGTKCMGQNEFGTKWKGTKWTGRNECGTKWMGHNVWDETLWDEMSGHRKIP
jgi:hypothetical protein